MRIRNSKARAAAPEVYNSKARDRVRRLRKEILDILGGPKCGHCGFTDPRALCVDHVNGDGYKHPEDKGTTGLYAKLKRSKDLSAYQVLCHNCNFIKREENCEKAGRSL